MPTEYERKYFFSFEDAAPHLELSEPVWRVFSAEGVPAPYDAKPDETAKITAEAVDQGFFNER
ncbi:MAG: hypothetical protein M3065_18665 [Actinomycetota bacterium]|nr:hypothetical protein [Actinomycetota bacterium]